MTDNEMLTLHKTLLDVSEVSALRAIYNLGYAAGAAVTPSLQMTDYSRSQSKPVDNTVASLKTYSAQKRD